MNKRLIWRKSVNAVMLTLTGVFTVLTVSVLFLILGLLLYKGASSLNWNFFTKLPLPAGELGGGLANAIVGTLVMTLLATLVAVPLGLMAGVYLAEFAQGSRLADNTRFSANVLIGMPSIIIGIFAYALVVVPLGRFSGYAGIVALAIIMLPIAARTTEDMLRLVPNTLREAALALGAPRWRITLSIVFRAAKAGLITGILLAVARVSGETAPLLFTALNSPYMMTSLGQPTPNLTVTIFNYAMSPYPDWQQKAWGASLLITGGVLALTLFTRYTLRERKT